MRKLRLRHVAAVAQVLQSNNPDRNLWLKNARSNLQKKHVSIGSDRKESSAAPGWWKNCAVRGGCVLVPVLIWQQTLFPPQNLWKIANRLMALSSLLLALALCVAELCRHQSGTTSEHHTKMEENELTPKKSISKTCQPDSPSSEFFAKAV